MSGGVHVERQDLVSRPLERVPTVAAPDAITNAFQRRADRLADWRAASEAVVAAQAGVDEATRLDLSAKADALDAGESDTGPRQPRRRRGRA
jgi:hypothetical protein